MEFQPTSLSKQKKKRKSTELQEYFQGQFPLLGGERYEGVLSYDLPDKMEYYEPINNSNAPIDSDPHYNEEMESGEASKHNSEGKSNYQLLLSMPIKGHPSVKAALPMSIRLQSGKPQQQKSMKESDD